MYTITFDMSCIGWSEDKEATYQYLKHMTNFINVTLEHCGYIYLNRIYEILGVKWNTRLKNICYLYEFGPLQFKIEHGHFNEWFIKFNN